MSTARGRLIADKAARWAVTAGGIGIIASILGILAFILIEVVPLVGSAGVEQGRRWTWTEPIDGGFLIDEHRTHLALLDRDGTLAILDSDDGTLVERIPIVDAENDAVALPLADTFAVPGQQVLYAQTADDRLLAVRVDWQVTFDESTRVVNASPHAPILFPLELGEAEAVRTAVQVASDGGAGAAIATTDGRLVVLQREVEENLFTGESSERWSRIETELDRTPTALVVDSDVSNIFAGAAGGELAWWRIRSGEIRKYDWSDEGDAITQLSMLIGERSLVVGRSSGALEIWFPVRDENEVSRLTLIRTFPELPGPVQAIAPSMRNKGFAAADDGGELGLYYSTSKRVLWRGRTDQQTGSISLTPKADALWVRGPQGVREWDIDNPHPEVSWTALFGKVWYESYPEPGYVWQSSGGTDDFEPKLSLVPLMIGTLKGTFYSLFLAIPLGVLGAMYTSQFMHPSLKRIVKPTVEVMAALPSVVLGFLAGLWLAPRVEDILPGLALVLVLVPLAVLLTGIAWRSVPQVFRGRFRAGSETLLYMVAVAVAMWVAFRLNSPFESFFFNGNIQEWLLDATGLRYDQRNAVVVGLAMGFAVIPIIFSIAEDAFSNVPNNLVSGSLALGANRWQTVTRVVLPTASPGIFSATMIGFGRAVGETMIVLMATGNTPVLDWNPFNGFRTLSANIAVEIPEAPQGGTLYRALFLAAVLLFVFTFVINTVAELVRQRLRRRYAEM